MRYKQRFTVQLTASNREHERDGENSVLIVAKRVLYELLAVVHNHMISA